MFFMQRIPKEEAMEDRFVASLGPTGWTVWDRQEKKVHEYFLSKGGAELVADRLNKKGSNAMTNIKVNYSVTPEIKVGDPVRNKHNGRYEGTVEKIITLRQFVVDHNGLKGLVYEENVELAPRLTPEEAWGQVPVLALRTLMEPSIGSYLYSYQYSNLRHECYKLLGGAGVKVNEETKRRVRNLVESVAGALSIEIVE
jgi:hypothetical protein